MLLAEYVEGLTLLVGPAAGAAAGVVGPIVDVKLGAGDQECQQQQQQQSSSSSSSGVGCWVLAYNMMSDAVCTT